MHILISLLSYANFILNNPIQQDRELYTTTNFIANLYTH